MVAISLIVFAAFCIGNYLGRQDGCSCDPGVAPVAKPGCTCLDDDNLEDGIIGD